MSVPVLRYVEALSPAELVPANCDAQAPRLGRGHRDVLLHLARRARDNGLAWPTIADIARSLWTSERQVQRLLRDLERAGLVRTKLQPGRRRPGAHFGNRYWVRVPWVAEPADLGELEAVPSGGLGSVDVEAWVDWQRARRAGARAMATAAGAAPRANGDAPPPLEPPMVTAGPASVPNAAPMPAAEVTPAAPKDVIRDAGQQKPHRGELQPPAGARAGVEPSADAERLWRAALAILEQQVSPAQFSAYLRPTRGASFEPASGVLEVVVADEFHIPWFEGRFAARVAAALGAVGLAGARVRYVAPEPAWRAARPRPRPAAPAGGPRPRVWAMPGALP
jgi:Helix-turn-helix domain